MCEAPVAEKDLADAASALTCLLKAIRRSSMPFPESIYASPKFGLAATLIYPEGDRSSVQIIARGLFSVEPEEDHLGISATGEYMGITVVVQARPTFVPSWPVSA